MARQTVAAEVNSFVKGIITEASPLTFPDNASIDELNLVLNKDGSRHRRLGMDYEDNAVIVNLQSAPDIGLVFTSFVWKSPGGYTDKEFLIIQSGKNIHIFDSTSLPVSGNLLNTFSLGADATSRMSMASVDGLLVVATGQGDIYTADYDGASVILSSGRLKIRDLFGVEDINQGMDLLNGAGLVKRPSLVTDAHTYNLRNQTFAYPRYLDGVTTPTDPLNKFLQTYGVLQSNSDNLVTFLYANANDPSDRNAKRYFHADNFANPLGTNRAPTGYFIIDAMNRGASRLAEYSTLMAQFPTLVLGVGGLPQDITPGGASVVAGFAGRMWFGGFSSQLTNGDGQSPRMTSYILFSRLVKTAADIFKCYQDGDPTSSEIPDLVDTDGGFLRLDGAFNIQHMINVGDSLMVIAENGVWKITGGSGYGFKATDYLTSKITEHGSISSGSVVVVDNSFMYWAEDGIYHVNQNQYGDWVASNLTTATIQSYYDDIGYTDKIYCQGLYDSYQRQIRWLYNNTLDTSDASKELILDIGLSAFYPSEISNTQGAFPRVLSIVKVPPFTTSSVNTNIISSSGMNVVDVMSNQIITVEDLSISSTSELYYLTATSISNGTVNATFSFYKDNTFRDFKSFDGVGVDAAAYLLTGWTGMGDFQRYKQVPYLTVYSIKTETGFDINLEPLNSSSISVQSQWSWTNLEDSGKWGTVFEAYRHKRLWIPQDNMSGFDDGESVVTTRNKLRGRGKVLSLKFSTKPGYDFHLLGWSFIAAINGTV